MHYRLRDALLPPGLISLSRVPLAMLFPWAVGVPHYALTVLLLAGFSDVLDGWLARRHGWVTATGSALDPVTDKLFVTTVAVTLVVTGQLSVGSVVLLSTREIGELPLVFWFATSRRARSKRVKHPAANLPGKAATVLQFATVSFALYGSTGLDFWVLTTAFAGALAAAFYWWRALSSVA